jgi:1,4-dihydroxy-2-naphthoate octaprenyltransferase
VLLAGGHARDWRVWLGFVSVHVFLYGGTTAFNSFYDRDEGPVGGMLRPPRVDPGLLPFSLAVQALGLPLALLVGVPFTLAWLLLFVGFTAYSHPRVRLKARWLAAISAITLGQGAIGFALGWLAAHPRRSLLDPISLTGMGSAALVVVGLYIVTQSYQTGEDRARGDRTLPVLLGSARALRLATLVLAPGGALMLAWLARHAAPAVVAVVALFFVAVAAWILAWAARFDEDDIVHNFTVAMRVATVSSTGLTLVVLALLVAG